ncbi:hypothetical protein [Pleionea litopenaei]|uniref:Uncharacterized protein n=1 Tax=Pleionea litopenaei TaxID=3070815 RepID=A0AA51RXB4_9GAMM|nr:hypothetical protein [Pleionea sp. HL-JVS1]WMS89174.1 hypothetical protein Q9312_09755 [Pleionea sp. HL-JVS1]
MTQAPINEEPRHSHYLLGHEAFRQAAEQDPEFFFHMMGSEQQANAVAQLVERVKSIANDGIDYDLNDFKVQLTQVEQRPTVIIQLPLPQAYIECLYLAVVSQHEFSELQNMEGKEHKISYYTLELMEREDGGSGFAFCTWEGESHFFLAELDADANMLNFVELIKAYIAHQAESANES